MVSGTLASRHSQPHIQNSNAIRTPPYACENNRPRYFVLVEFRNASPFTNPVGARAHG